MSLACGEYTIGWDILKNHVAVGFLSDWMECKTTVSMQTRLADPHIVSVNRICTTFRLVYTALHDEDKRS